MNKSVKILLVLLAMLSGPVYRSQGAWPTEEDMLQRGDIIVTSEKSPLSDFDEVRGLILLKNTPLDLVWKVITDYARYAEFFTDIQVSRVTKSEPPFSSVYFEKSNLFPIPNYKYTVQMIENKDTGKIEWRLEDGNIKNCYGAWRIQAAGDKNQDTKVTLVMLQDSGSFLMFLPEDMIINPGAVLERLNRLRRITALQLKKIESEPGKVLIPRWGAPLRDSEDKKKQKPPEQKPPEQQPPEKSPPQDKKPKPESEK